MAEHAVGNMVVLTGEIVMINGNLAVVRVDKAFPEGGTIIVQLGKLPDDGPSDEDLIRRAMKKAAKHPGREVKA